MTDDPHTESERAGGDLSEKVEAASGPLYRMAAVAAQVGLSKIPADASCQCLCSIYVPHLCDGWRVDGCTREIPSPGFLGIKTPPTVVPLCRACHGVELRQG